MQFIKTTYGRPSPADHLVMDAAEHSRDGCTAHQLYGHQADCLRIGYNPYQLQSHTYVPGGCRSADGGMQLRLYRLCNAPEQYLITVVVALS